MVGDMWSIDGSRGSKLMIVDLDLVCVVNTGDLARNWTNEEVISKRLTWG